MNPSLYLSRARLRHDAPTDALRDALSRLADARVAAGHRLIWTLFGDTPDRRRDFLWREAEPGTFHLLSARPPVPNELFHLDPPKTFAPALAPGDRLRFVLRANATVARKPAGTIPGSGVRGKRCDVVMDAIHSVPKGQRAQPRQAVLSEVAVRWLSGQGDTHGFSLANRKSREPWEADASDRAQDALEVMGYRVLRLGRSRGRKALQLGVLELQGTLVVQDPTRFIAALAHGFGRGKAFGCGLMLIRRAA
jgi:CRISPR system Cascade subunit CasE